MTLPTGSKVDLLSGEKATTDNQTDNLKTRTAANPYQ